MAFRSAPSNSRNRLPILALLSANTISHIGTQFTLLALPWFVLQTTGSAAKAGLTGSAIALPLFLGGFFGGTLVDRLSYRRASVVADVVSGIGVGLVPTLYYTVGLPFPVLLALVFLGELLAIPGLTARRSLLPDVASLVGLRLERVNSAFESTQQLAQLLGPPIGGILIAWLGASRVLWIDAGTFAFSAVIIGLGLPSFRSQAGLRNGRRYLNELREGLRFLFQERLLRALAISVGITNAITNPLFAVILPVYVARSFGEATDLGLVMTAVGAGSLLGATGYGVFGYRLPRRAVWLAGFATLALPFWVLATGPSLLPLMCALAIEAVFVGPLNPLMVTIRHERIPAPLRGRVFSTFSAITAVVTPLGMALVGAAVEEFDLVPIVLVLAVVGQLVGFAMPFVPVFRNLDPPPAPAYSSTH